MNSLADKSVKHFIGRKIKSDRLGLVKIKVENRDFWVGEGKLELEEEGLGGGWVGAYCSACHFASF